MHNTNNKVNYEINVKQKYSWSTVFAWLYLKTIGRILPKRWNRWAENILYYDKTTANNEVQTDAFKTIDGSVQVDLKPEVVEKESQSEVMSEDEGIQTEVSDEFIDEDYDSMEEVSIEEDEELQKQLEDVSQELELERSQNVLLKEENEELRSKLAECEKDYTELEDVSGQLEEELSAELKEKSKLIFGLSERLIECNIESLNEIKRLLVEVEKHMKINSLMRLNEGLDEDKKEMEAKVVEDLRKHLQSAQESKQQLEKERIDLESKLKDLSSQLSAAEVEKKSSESEVSKLQKQVQILEESKEWELAGIGDTLNKTSLSVMELLAQQLPLNNQEQQLEHLNAELERVRSVAMSSIQAHSETLDENLTLKNQQIESSTAKDEQQNGKLTEDIQGQTKTKASDTVSCMGTVSKTTNRIKGIPNSLINSSVSVQQSGKIR